jgi:hypothetical protein
MMESVLRTSPVTFQLNYQQLNKLACLVSKISDYHQQAIKFTFVKQYEICWWWDRSLMLSKASFSLYSVHVLLSSS